jgi:hypothetical protein
MATALAYDRRLGLSQQRKDGNTGVTTNDGDLVLVGLGRLSNDGRNEGGSSDNVEVGDTEQPGISCFRGIGLVELTSWGQRHRPS